MNLPNRINPGDPIRASTLNALIDYVRAATIAPGVGYTRNVTANGTTLRIAPAVRFAGTSVEGEERYLNPILTTTKGANPSPAWSVTPGLVNSERPTTSTGTVGLTTDLRDWAVPFTTEGDIFVHAHLGSSSEDESFAIEFIPGHTPQRPAPTLSDAYWRIGRIAAVADSDPVTYEIIPYNKSNLRVASCGEIWVWVGDIEAAAVVGEGVTVS